MIARALVAVALLLAGCVHYPSVEGIGGVRIRPDKGRAVRAGDGYAVYMEIVSTGKFGDLLIGATTTVAQQARLVNAGGDPRGTIDIPGATTVVFAPGGPHLLLTDLTRPLATGETIIITLLFAKSGGIGVVTLVE